MSQHRTTELEYALTKQEKYKELVGKLQSLNGHVPPEEAHHLYNTCLTWINDFNACQITEIGKLVKEKLGISATLFNRDLKRREKVKVEDSGEKKEKAQNGKEPLTASFPGLVDIIDVDGKPAFFWTQDGKISWYETTEIEGQVYLPPPREHLPWLLPSGVEVLKHYRALEKEGIPWVQNLCDEIYNFLFNASELPSDDYYKELLIPWILHTYLLEHFDYSPILCLYAVPERGKSRMGKALSYLSYRGTTMESLRESNIIRLATDCRATIFFDCMGLWKKVERNQSEDVILARCERGSVVPRVLYPERGAFKDTKIYTVFGSTVLATNESIHEILETRAVTINMPEASRRFAQNITPGLALPLKEKLTAFRAYYLDKPLPEVPKPATGRLGDIFQPLYQIVHLVWGEKGSPSFQKFVEKLDAERRLERSDTIEAEIIRAIVALETEVERGILTVKAITETVNEARPEGKKLSPQRIGRLLNALGLDRGFTNDGHKAIVWNGDKIMRLQGRYGVKISSDMSVTSVSAGNITAKTDITDVTDDSFRGGSPENSHIFNEQTSPSIKYPDEVCCKCNKQASRKTYGKDNNARWGVNFYCDTCDAV